MAKDRQGLILTLLIINTVLLAGIFIKTGCVSKSVFCPISKKGSGYDCPLLKKGSSLNVPINTQNTEDIPSLPSIN